MSKKVGVVVAVELGAVLERYGEPAAVTELTGYTVRIYRKGEAELFVVRSGEGEIAAAAATQLLIDRFNVDMILNFGVVGALSAEMATAEICVVEKVVHHQFRAIGWRDLPRGQYFDRESPYFAADADLVEKAAAVEPKLRRVVCASGDAFIDTAEEKLELARECGADICEMEAAGIVITCERNRVPCLLLKAVSDSLTGGDKEFYKEVERVSAICFEVADRVIATLA